MTITAFQMVCLVALFGFALWRMYLIGYDNGYMDSEDDNIRANWDE